MCSTNQNLSIIVDGLKYLKGTTTFWVQMGGQDGKCETFGCEFCMWIIWGGRGGGEYVSEFDSAPACKSGTVNKIGLSGLWRE